MQMPTLIILAGGASSRMWPLREKSLIRFGTDPLMISQLKQYQSIGFKDVVIVGNPENYELLQNLTRNIEGMNINLTIQEEAIGMGDAVLKAESFLKDKSDQAIYITQVHDVVDMSLHIEMLEAHRKNPQHSLLAGYRVQSYFPGGYLVVNDEGRISGIKEKPGAGFEPSDLVTFVAHIHSQAGQLFDAIRAEYGNSEIDSDDHYERAMDKLMAKQDFFVVPYSGHWSALKFPWHTLEIMDYFLGQIVEGQHIHPSVSISDTARISGNVIIEEGVKIFPGAAIVGPAYIGKGTIIGNNALVRHSMLLEKCEVGYTSEVARSYVANHVSMHACRVLDSVLADHVNFSAGSTTANLRIDRDHVRSVVKGNRLDTGRDKLGAIIGQNAFIGVDVMTMPGVKIGENAQIGPGTHVQEDIRNGLRVYVKQEYIIIDTSE